MRYFCIFLFLICLSLPVYADVSLLLHEAKGFSGETTGAGHSAVYLSDVCADPPPFVLRKCRDKETRGAVIATYPDFGANNDYKWFAMPLNAYLYGVDKDSQIPLYANGEIRLLLRETIRQKYLADVVPKGEDGTLPPGRWVEIIGTALNRDLYAFNVKTTPEQDEQFIKKYSLLVKGNDFQVFYKNCADFTKDIMNSFFPHSSKRDFINDLTMTTPKAITRSFSKYAQKRPQLLFHVTKYPQLDGTIMRSFGNRNFTETAFTSKKYVITQALTMPVLLPLFAGSYFMTGYFSVDRTHQNFPSLEMAQLNLEKDVKKKTSGFAGNSEAIREIDSKRKAEKIKLFGAGSDWKNYKAELNKLISKAIAEKLFVDDKEVKTFFKDLEFQSEPFFDQNGFLMLKVVNYGKESMVGITKSNMMSEQSDIRLAYKLILVKLKTELDASKNNRVSFLELQENWRLMMDLKAKSDALPAVENPTNARFLTMGIPTKTSKKISLIFREITH
jgi:hypothetical protein